MSQDNQTLIPDVPKASRRGLLLGAPAVAAVALAGGTVANAVAIGTAKADESDPIFDVIERHREALAREDAAHQHFEEMDALYPVNLDCLEEHTPRNAAYDAWNDLCNVRCRITEELLATAPTTVAGLAALLQHWADVVADDDAFDNCDTMKLLTALAGGLRGWA
jgi:hypothetical protein